VILRAVIFPLSLTLLGPIPGKAQLWEFNEVTGTGLHQVLSSSGGFWNSQIAGVTADGRGSLNFVPSLSTDSRSFVPIPAVSTGIYELKVVLAGWNFAGAPVLGPLLEVGLANSTTGLPTRSVAHFRMDANASNMALFGSAGGPASTETPGSSDQPLPLERITPLTIKLLVNFTAGTYHVSTSEDNFTRQASGLLASPRRIANFLFIRTSADFTVGGQGFLKAQRLSFGALYAVSAFATWQVQHFSEPDRAKESIAGMLADPAGDGIPNLIAFALGRSPFPSLQEPPLTMDLNGEAFALNFRRPTDPVAAGVSHILETSEDLQAWSPWVFQTLSIRDDGDGYETVFVNSLTLPPPALKRFFRLRIVAF